MEPEDNRRLSPDIISRLHTHLTTAPMHPFTRLVLVHVWNDAGLPAVRLEGCAWTAVGVIDEQQLDCRPGLPVDQLGRETSVSLKALLKYCMDGAASRRSLPIGSSVQSVIPEVASALSSPRGANTDTGLRKIRPVNELGGPEFTQVVLQKRLRKWFWWMYPGVKDLVDGLAVFLSDTVREKDGDAGKRTELCARLDTALDALVTGDCWMGGDVTGGNDEAETHRRTSRSVELTRIVKLLAHEHLDRLVDGDPFQQDSL